MTEGRVSGYCHRCEAERELVETVPWQSNYCPTCGSEDVTAEGA